VVPSSAKSAVFWEIGISCPSQNAQPVGGKLNGKMRISATNWSDMSARSSGLAREDPEQGDDVVEAEERLRVLVRLAASRAKPPGVHLRVQPSSMYGRS
jgi:hypothetical protein